MSDLEFAYNQEVSWLFEQFPSYQNIGAAAYKPDLGNIKELIEIVNIDFSHIQFIHIAGTNGKGTCTNYLGSILKESGYKTGIFTSPHIVDFRERICINGENISQEFVVNFCKQIKELAIKPSFFEITFAMALCYFVDQKCQFVVVETGLGGRLDATNVIVPILSIITNIGLDHVQLLGDTLAQIAYEKAGIIKPLIPVLIGETTSETLPVFQQIAAERNSKLYFSENFEVKDSYFEIQNFKRKNEKTILKAVEIIRDLGIEISEKAVDLGFKNIHQNTNYIGRFQVISENPLTIIDVAHNEDGIRELLQSIDQITHTKLHIVYGSSSDKDFMKIIAMFPREAHLYFTEFSSYRSVKIETVKDEVQRCHYNTSFYSSLSESLKEVKKNASGDDLVLITGSFYLISDYFS